VGVGRQLRRDEILLALNDHCGEQVFVSITAEELELRAGFRGRLMHWTESPDNLPLDAPPLRDDEGTYRVGDAHFTVPGDVVGHDVVGREHEDERGGWLEIYVGESELSVWWEDS
jgi:hypothetical protein